MKRPPRKPPVFVRCPVCGTEFRRTANQRWCSRDCVAQAGHIAALEGAPSITARIRKADAPTPEAIRHQVDAAAATMWRDLVRRAARKDRL
jgi:hypothetical protein